MFNFPFSLALPLASYNSQTNLSAAQSLIIANSITCTATKSSANANHKTSQLVTTTHTTVVFPFSALTAGPRCALPN